MHQTKHKKSSHQPCEAKKHVTWTKHTQSTQIPPDLQTEKKIKEKRKSTNQRLEKSKKKNRKERKKKKIQKGSSGQTMCRIFKSKKEK